MQKQSFCEVQHQDVEFGTNIKNVKNQKHTIWAPVNWLKSLRTSWRICTLKIQQFIWN